MEVAIFLGLYPCKQGFKLLDPFPILLVLIDALGITVYFP